MAKGYEERFPYSKLTYHLEQFLLEKVRTLEKDIESELIVKKKAELARKYIAKVKAILQTKYFGKQMRDVYVYQLMEQLKQDCKEFNRKITDIENQIHCMEKILETSEEYNPKSDYMIPDEAAIHQQAIAKKRHQFCLEIQTVRDELKAYNYRLELCRNLQGIIARPNGFFSAVYKL